MSADTERRAKLLFDEAFELSAPEREAFLSARCVADVELRARVERLLAAADTDDAFLREPAEHAAFEHDEQPGSTIGPYRLLERLGEGGFGVVYLAEQLAPVQRRVALKIVKPGMDSRAVVARFEHERQVLTLMDHPHIARVLEAGVTPLGRPYFAMEYVPGRPIAEYCDRHELTLPARLELFAQACAAVQHAHTKGILHRDLKSGNVLVGLRDGAPSVKVIDFGIAKAIDPGTNARAFVTEAHQLVGTPGHMSPEQAGAARDVDTRSDVYSLGVLLYELLAGSLPFELERLRDQPPSELQRIVREVEPERPSARLARDPSALVLLAQRRGTTPERLRAQVRGELDWIVMRALEKERERRYGSVAALADDVRRHAAGEAVEAAPPSTTYRLRKVVRKHRGAVLAAALITAALLVGTIATALGWKSSRAGLLEARRQSEVSLAILTLLTNDLLSGVDPGSEGGRADVTVREMLDRAAARLDSGVSLHAVEPAVRATVEIAVRCAASRSYRTLGLYDAALVQAARAADLAESEEPPQPSALADAMFELGELLRVRQQHTEAEALLRRALTLRRETRGADGLPYAEAASALAGMLLQKSDRLDEAEELALRVLAIHREVLGPRSAQAAVAMGNLAQVYTRMERPIEALELLEVATEIHRELLGEEHVDYVRDLFNLGSAACYAGDLAKAEQFTAAALEKLEQLYPDDHPVVAMCRRNLGFVLLGRGEPAEALPYLRAALAAERKASGPSKSLLSSSLSYLGRALLALEEPVEAAEVLAEFVAVIEQFIPDAPPWKLAEAKGLHAQARLDTVRADLAALPADGALDPELSTWFASELTAIEPDILLCLESLRDAPSGASRFVPDAESRRCLAAARAVLLYETWSVLDARDAAHPEAARHAEALTRSRAELAHLRAEDADAPLVAQ